jgi:hypothetical protein
MRSYIEITGHRARKKHCFNVVNWVLEKYLPRHQLDIMIHHRGLLREGVYGWCTVQDCDYRPRAFLIEIHNYLTLEDYLQTILHEMWHVYQHVRGDLRDKGSLQLWKGIDYSDKDYDDLPWEKEASKMEKELFQEYLTDHPQTL